ncbi:MAG: UDP-N-acetylmuramoyl-L-alanine--D-glutamate ligase [Holosporaceae bacterium]|jgi:UDP-N-acetylmuramoylalanine--D-glutamate ligase|nr:UDP-N-acetylmuramoyl-L-alanine--D-glutamate ligase [Holosporaceae bacterium]
MIILDFCKNKKFGVIGFGKTGKSVADSLRASGANVKIHDDNSNEKFDPDEKFDAIAVSPGISTLWPGIHPMIRKAKENFIPILNDADLFQRQLPNKIKICVTGTNGKSTTAALIHHLLSFAGQKSVVGGNFGNPVLSLDSSADFFVLELSSYQLESCNILGFDVAILLNITPDHLTRHGGMEGYISAKQKIFANFHERSAAIIGVDDDHCLKIFNFLKTIKHPCVIPISGNRVPQFGVGWDAGRLIDDRFGSGEIICEKNSALDGNHNLQNIAAAYVAYVRNGADQKKFREGLFSFGGLEHRQEIVASIDGVLYINDSKATNADSAEKALQRFDDIIWILGGRPKEDGIESLVKYFGKVRFAFLIGEAAQNWSHLLTQHGVKNEVAGTLETAVARSEKAAADLGAKVVLLSPACASFDQFENFEDRGNKFKKSVRKEK